MAFDFISYIENLASISVHIGHSETNKRFFRVSGIRAFEELLNNVARANMPCIGADDTFQGKLRDMDSDLLMDDYYYNFYVFHRTKLFDFDHNQSCFSKLKQITDSFIARLIQDHRLDFNLESNTGLRYLDINSISYNTLTPLADGIVCMGISFVVKQPFFFNNLSEHFNE